jgi:hypothetical protein
VCGKPPLALAFVQIGMPEAAHRKGLSRFPQPIPFVWKADASIANKTQYIVVFC